MGFLLLVSMAGKTSWLEQALEALNADDKNLLRENRQKLFKTLKSTQRTSDAEFYGFFLGKEDGISRDFPSKLYIPSSTSTMGTFVAWK